MNFIIILKINDHIYIKMEASSIENLYVKQSYSLFAKEFDSRRIFKWTECYKFINNIPTGSKLFDVGCGNGRNMLLRKDLVCTGCDLCYELLHICTEKKLNVFQCDIRNIPVKNNSFDYSICIAVIGHIFDENDRIMAIKELLRVTDKEIFIQCWDINAINHSKNKDKFECIKDNDYFVTWGVKKIKRYYHLFTLDEFNDLLIKSGAKIIESYIDITGVIAKIRKY